MKPETPKSPTFRGIIRSFLSLDPDKAERLIAALTFARPLIRDKANEMKFCPACDSPIDDVKTSYNIATAVQTLYKLVAWCVQTGRHEFRSDEVKDLLDHTQYANLNHLDRFGGIVYRPVNPKSGKMYRSTHYGINLTRAWEFFRNERPAPVQLITKRLTGERIASTDKYCRDFPALTEFLDADGNYDPEHIIPADGAVPHPPLPFAV